MLLRPIRSSSRPKPGVPSDDSSLWTWLVGCWQWPSAALFAAAFLFALLPLIAGLDGAIGLVFLQLPIYMLHQWEEHTGDRFRQYANRVIGGGREVLTPTATFWINSLGVWGVDLAALYLAWAVTPAAGLIAAYLALVNSLLHIGPALVRREYNPGLVTAAILFPLAGGWCVLTIGATCGPAPHLIALGGAIGIHLLIVAYVASRLRRLCRAAS
ncbi:MAG TPA: HXXEE domain-containing protein [Pirellulaceae bacterium]|nr:HXXEE domain-containing protein [Pirellulaceae bacterium]